MTLGLFRRLQGLQLCDLEAYISEYVPPGVSFRFMHAFSSFKLTMSMAKVPVSSPKPDAQRNKAVSGNS